MSPTPLRVVLVAEEAAGMQALRLLLKSGCELAAVIAAPDARTNGMASVWSLAQQMKLPVWPADGVCDGRYAAAMRAARADLLLNVHALHVIHAEVLDATRLGAFNLHPSPLPRYAGLNSVSWALYRGEATHGVTLHRMLPAIDTGDIAFQRLFAVADDDTALSLYSKCARAGMELIQQLIAAAENGAAIPSIAQDLSQREFFRRRDIPQDGLADWNRPARDVVNFVRACDYHPFPSPWGYPKAFAAERQIAIGRARLTGRAAEAVPGTVISTSAGACEVACADECIRVERIEVGGRTSEPAAILCAGDRLENGSSSIAAIGSAAE